MQERADLQVAQSRLVAQHGLLQPARKRLAPEYSDKDGGFLADPPVDPRQWFDPDTLVLAYYKDAEVETQPVDWEGFQVHLSQATGRKIAGQEYLNSADEVDAIKAGAIQLVALHAADTPYLVNNAGFIPVAVLGTAEGAHGNHLVIAVAAKSDIKTLADIRGRTLTCTVPDSITGYRAAIAVLWQEAGIRPDVDYAIHFSHGQKRSVLGVAAGDFEVAALSDDKLQTMLKKGTVQASDYRIIHESQVIPRLTIGYVYNLKPDLAAQVVAAALSFANEEGATEESTGAPMRFFAIDYKKDFEFVRRIDDSFDPRVHKRPREKPTPAPAGNPAE
ncbi:MAG: PhnD/SsuA/transferrin family substrate-binding protein [Planctomycetia bacterium]|nr:PhnD/SsuA/transferrin family substrate-binding protein [Planctomycetia bacterium]